MDTPDVRFVVHDGLPRSIAALYQEASRAGRDGAPADHVLCASLNDWVTALERRAADFAGRPAAPAVAAAKASCRGVVEPDRCRQRGAPGTARRLGGAALCHSSRSAQRAAVAKRGPTASAPSLRRVMADWLRKEGPKLPPVWARPALLGLALKRGVLRVSFEERHRRYGTRLGGPQRLKL